MKSLRLFPALAATLALAALIVTSAPAAAQGFKWWLSEQYIKELGLTAEQSRRVEEIFQKALPTMKTQKATLDASEKRFEQLVEGSDDSTVMEQVNVVEAARAELNKTRTLMLLAMRKVLTRDQWAKFTALHQQTERERQKAAAAAK